MSDVATIRDDGPRLLSLARRVTARLKRPPSLDPEDMTQDAVVALLEVIDAIPHRPLPAAYPPELALVLRARQKLGGKAAYWDEWQWSNRRWFAVSETDPDPLDAAPAGPSAPFCTTDATLVDTLLDMLPKRLHHAARHLLTPSDTPRGKRWEESGMTYRLFYRHAREIVGRLEEAGLWSDSMYNTPGWTLGRPKKPKPTE